MNIENKYPVMIFKREYQGKTFYYIVLNKKDKVGKYINGYMTCRFKNGVEIDDKKKIYIKNAWLDFYLKDKVTIPYIFINKFAYVEEDINKMKEEIKKEVDGFQEFANEIQITDLDLPF